MVQANLLRVRVEFGRLAPATTGGREKAVYRRGKCFRTDQTRAYLKFGASDLWMPLHTSWSIKRTRRLVSDFAERVLG